MLNRLIFDICTFKPINPEDVMDIFDLSSERKSEVLRWKLSSSDTFVYCNKSSDILKELSVFLDKMVTDLWVLFDFWVTINISSSDDSSFSFVISSGSISLCLPCLITSFKYWAYFSNATKNFWNDIQIQLLYIHY